MECTIHVKRTCTSTTSEVPLSYRSGTLKEPLTLWVLLNYTWSLGAHILILRHGEVTWMCTVHVQKNIVEWGTRSAPIHCPFTSCCFLGLFLCSFPCFIVLLSLKPEWSSSRKPGKKLYIQATCRKNTCLRKSEVLCTNSTLPVRKGTLVESFILPCSLPVFLWAPFESARLWEVFLTYSVKMCFTSCVVLPARRQGLLQRLRGGSQRLSNRRKKNMSGSSDFSQVG